MGSNSHGSPLRQHSLVHHDDCPQEIKTPPKSRRHLGFFHTHAVADILSGATTGPFAKPELCALFLPVTNSRGAFYGSSGRVQFLKQIVGASFVIGWNVVVTSIICFVIRLIVLLQMPEEQLLVGDDAVHGEEAYPLWGDGGKYYETKHWWYSDDTTHHNRDPIGAAAVSHMV